MMPDEYAEWLARPETKTAIANGRLEHASSWGPQVIEFAKFHLDGSTEVRILLPAAGLRDVQVEIFGADLDGNWSTTVALRLTKARARALASAIMDAAAEL